MLKTLLIALIAFLGSLVGVFLARIAPEEIAPGKRYFNLARRLFLIAIAVILFSNVTTNPAAYVALIIGLIIGYYLRQPYLYLGFALALATLDSMALTLIIATLIFLYGLPYGSTSKDIVENVPYFIVPFALLFFPQFTTDTTLWLALLAGALVLQK